MTTNLQLGRLAYTLESPVAIPWKDSDRQFLTEPDAPAVTVSASLTTAERLPPLPQQPVFQGRGLTVCQDGEWEVRSYYAMFLPGYPNYMRSRSCGNRVELLYNRSSGLLQNPNFSLWSVLHLEAFLLKAGALDLHSCYTEYRGEAILFTAPSGTGKTTQANLWKRVYGASIVNGDKCLLQRTEDGWLACGFPYHGSAPECENRSFPIRAIVVVRQAPENRVERLSPTRALGLLYSECTVNHWNAERAQRALELLGGLIAQVPVVLLRCNMEEDAARTLHRYLY